MSSIMSKFCFSERLNRQILQGGHCNLLPLDLYGHMSKLNDKS